MATVLTGLRAGLYIATRFGGGAEAVVRNPRPSSALLSRQVAHPERVRVDTPVADLRSERTAPVVLPLLRVVRNSPVRPITDSRCPIRVVWGEQDRMIPLEPFGRPLMDRLPGAELVMLDAGHVPMWDRPDEVVELILEVSQRTDALSPGNDTEDTSGTADRTGDGSVRSDRYPPRPQKAR